MSGGDTKVEFQIGEYSSTPIDSFTLSVMTADCRCGNDQYNFLYDPLAFFDVSFPGYLDHLIVSFFFRLRHTPGPITSVAIPTQQPNPADFHDVQIVYRLDGGDDHLLTFRATLDPLIVPEPATCNMLIVLLCGTVMSGIRRRRSELDENDQTSSW